MSPNNKKVFRKLEGILLGWLPSSLRVSWQALKTRRKMNRQFGRRLDPFDFERSEYEKIRLNAMEEAIIGNPQEVLEIGCAEGHFTARLAGRVQNITALDISDVALERARGRAPNARFIKADLLEWAPSVGQLYDLIVLTDTLYYLERPIVQTEFNALFGSISSWITEAGYIILANGFGDEPTLLNRRSFRERFEKTGLILVSERIVGEAGQNGVRCLLSVLRK